MDFARGRHAGGEDQGLALLRQVPEEREVGQVARGDFERGHLELLQDIGAFLVEGSREEEQAALAAVSLDLLVPLGLELERPEHLELGPGGSRVRGLVFRLGRVRGDEVVGPERLELHGVGAGIGRRVHELQRQIQTAVVVDPGLRNEEAGLTLADLLLADGEGRRRGAPGERRLGDAQLGGRVDVERPLGRHDIREGPVGVERLLLHQDVPLHQVDRAVGRVHRRHPLAREVAFRLGHVVLEPAVGRQLHQEARMLRGGDADHAVGSLLLRQPEGRVDVARRAHRRRRLEQEDPVGAVLLVRLHPLHGVREHGDVRRRVARQLGGPQERDFRAALPRDAGDLLVVRGNDDAQAGAGPERRVDGPCDERLPRHGDDVLARDSLGPSPRRDHGQHLAHAPTLPSSAHR